MDSIILVNDDIIRSVPAHLFDRGTHDGQTESSEAGRGTVILFRYADQDLVLKTYYRGGLPGRLIRNTYLYTGLERTRMWREFRLLKKMHELGLPVPIPVAARCLRPTLFSYRGDLIMRRIDGAKTLSELITRQALPEVTWSRIGEVIARFHSNRVFHRDLNASNIILDPDDKIYLIDFDKCYFRNSEGGSPDGWPSANLKRLQQSLRKLSSHLATCHYDDDNWLALKRGYMRTARNLIGLAWLTACAHFTPQGIVF